MNINYKLNKNIKTLIVKASIIEKQRIYFDIAVIIQEGYYTKIPIL